MLWERGKAYGQDLREQMFAASDGGAPVGAIARMLFVSTSYVSKALRWRRQTGETIARPQRCRVPAKLTAWHAVIEEQVASRANATPEGLKAWLLQPHVVGASTTLIWETLDHLTLTFKKDHRRDGTGST
jgi:transposase